MPFTLPQFNCLFNGWRLNPATGVWDRVVSSEACQHYVNSREQPWAYIIGATEEIMLHHLRTPMGTDIAEGDIVEVEPGEEWFYQLIETERVHKNFPNEYLVGYSNILDWEDTPFFIATELVEKIQTENGPPYSIYTEYY